MVRPKKHLGQHFLTDPSISKRIADAIPSSAMCLLEVGPGKGALSQFLFTEGRQVLLAEIDDESADHLLTRDDIPAESILRGDFLKMDLSGLFEDTFWIVGNFPYNISSQILFRMYENHELVDGLLGMFQREVAQRIVAGPGSKTYGILSVLLQSLYDVEYLFTVSEGSFFPPPKVKSGVIKLTRNPSLPGPKDKNLFAKIVKTAFNQRRKTLRNALKPIWQPELVFPEELAGKRAEQLGVDEFLRLEEILKKVADS